MLTDDERNKVIEKVQFEREIRRALAEEEREPKPTSLAKRIWDKASSSLGLLLIGGVLTGFLVPTFQEYQKRLEWERQIRYENVKFNLDMRRDCLKEMMLAGTDVSAIKEAIKPYQNERPLAKDEYDKLRLRLSELQNERFKQNAKVVAMLVYFSDYKTASALFDEYTRASTGYIGDDVERFLYLKYSLSNKGGAQQGDRIELARLLPAIDDTSDLTQKFDRVLDYMLADIKQKEEEYAKAKF